jgi:hypothetical protein
MSWTTPVHQSPDPPGTSTEFNAQVVDNLEFLHDGVPLWLPSLSEDCNKIYNGVVNNAVLVPTMSKDVITVSRLAWRTNSAGGQFDVGIYLDDGNDLTVSKVTSSGLVPMPGGSGANSQAFVGPVTLQPFVKYWLVMGFSSANASLNGTDGPAQSLCKKATNSMPLPNVITFGSPRPTVSPCLAALP